MPKFTKALLNSTGMTASFANDDVRLGLLLLLLLLLTLLLLLESFEI